MLVACDRRRLLDDWVIWALLKRQQRRILIHGKLSAHVRLLLGLAVVTEARFSLEPATDRRRCAHLEVGSERTACITAAVAMISLIFEWDWAHLLLVLLIRFCRDVDIVVAEGQKLAFQSVDWLETVHLQILDEVNIIPDDIFPKFWSEECCCED